MYGIPQTIEVSKHTDGKWYASLIVGPADEQWLDHLAAVGHDRNEAVGRLKANIRQLIANQWEAGCKVVDRKANAA